MAPHPIPDPGVLKIAKAFQVAAQNLNTFSNSNMSVPTIVNAAFALELYLKSLNMDWQLQNLDEIAKSGKIAWLASRTPIQKGHIPSKLFEALEQSIQESLEKQYTKEERHTPAHYWNKPTTLIAALKMYDGVFQDWRYIFEGRAKTIDIQALLDLLQFFSETISNMPLKWA